MASIALVLASATTYGDKDFSISTRPVAHWSGIILALLPLAWFNYWWLQGEVFPRELFVRILD